MYYSFTSSTFKTNFNPFVEINGKKVFYQRDLVWTLDDKQKLIDSLYQNIPIGKFVFRKRPYEWCKENNSERFEVVDGKQRFSTLREFWNNEFCDSKGYYWKDFSDSAKRKFLNLFVTISEIPDSISDSDVFDYFLRLNTFGKVMSSEHLEKVKKEVYD